MDVGQWAGSVSCLLLATAHSFGPSPRNRTSLNHDISVVPTTSLPGSDNLVDLCVYREAAARPTSAKHIASLK